MFKKKVLVGNIPIGGGERVSIQSMTNTDTRNVGATLSQIRALVTAGCDIVRVSVFDKECLNVIKTIVDNSNCPIVADIHFDYRLAIGAVERGVAKLRINPGNIGSDDKVRILSDCCKQHNVPIRIGVNSGSLEKDILAKYGGVTAEGMVESAMRHVRILEDTNFDNIVLSLKASNVPLTVNAYRLISKTCNYPLHLGITEAGLPEEGGIKSAVGIGTLLMEGIGDTIRVSLSTNPVAEVYMAKNILKATGHLEEGIDIISCPTCGRTRINLEETARRVRDGLKDIKIPLKVAVMGCVVNGPGEAKEADIGIAGGDGSALLIKKGEKPVKMTGDYAAILIEEVKKLVAKKQSGE
ncbi:MAG: flavodoxin-dependent (E)-4-hydroxy-3-methylbut-2-enyl-diphosphate synthase [Christensenellaceae bacterium]|nr:flavodoxin-dependent (E)-4-hydroxy-3-methylbut-2-enyl-diphosphate synthase [Christensenellaceae bacterium]